MDKEQLKELAEEFGLPLIERCDTITIVGIEKLLIFNNISEETQCQLIEIY